MAAMIQIKINDSYLLAIAKAGAKLNDFSKPMAEYVAYLEGRTRMNFVRETDPEGVRWKDLKPNTWSRKKSNSILRESGRLVNSISSSSSKSQGAVETNVDYAKALQKGTSKMNARPFMGVNKEDEERGMTIFERWAGRMVDNAA